ncbi:hypothetical protein C5167_010504 [Papaver somniferum]|uniref:Protein kinase domain-containing protein n=1 Tax=Papaver somniferum TaxID=3469 RepID=A0A4Y7K1L2_PAPSO|nr:hypothetical protein C5167_010504 [Papaver somniferum]
MAMDDNESCNSRTVDSSPTHPRQQRQKLEVYNEVLRRLKDSNNEEALTPGFEDELWSHFHRLPTRYALDVNAERAEDVLKHKRLLQLAHDPANRPAFDVRLVQVPAASNGSDYTLREGDAQSPIYSSKRRVHPPPAFGSSPNLEALALEAGGSDDDDGDSIENESVHFTRPMHEITFSTDDKPKLLSQLTSLLAEIGLNIQEAHAFSTNDGYSLDVFVVEGWEDEETEHLRQAVKKEVSKFEKKFWSKSQVHPVSSIDNHEQSGSEQTSDHVKIPTDGTDVWEIDAAQLKFENKVASGSYGDLYKGTYCSQEVAIKVLKPERVNEDMQQEFAQEVYIMRSSLGICLPSDLTFDSECTCPQVMRRQNWGYHKKRGKRVTSTRISGRTVTGLSVPTLSPPSFVFQEEFMSGGSVYDFLHKHKGVFKLPSLLKVAIDVSKGMNYLHQNNIIHRDLKAANLLMDENELPYEYLTPLQAAVGVVQKGLRPTIPKQTHPKLAELLEKCWQQDPSLRPDFSEIIDILRQITKEVVDDGEEQRKKEKPNRFPFLRRNSHHH